MERSNVLPDTGGDGAVYLASKTNAVVLPVAVDTAAPSEVGMARGIIATLRNRPKVRVIVGEPFETEDLDISAIESLLQKRAMKESVTEGDRTRFTLARQNLQAQSERLMRTLAQLLPAQKRGRW